MENITNEQLSLLTDVTNKLRNKQLMVCTAESCSGGQLAMLLTDLDGSSKWFERGFVTYTNDAKSSMLGVSPDLIIKNGAVSELVAEAMAQGALINSKADIAISITGVAGPTGGTAEKPVGMVCFGLASKESSMVETLNFGALERRIIRARTCLHALGMIDRYLSK